MKCIHLFQVDINIKIEILCNLLAQRATVFILDPSIGTYKTEHPLWSKEVKTFLEKQHIEICAVVKSGKTTLVFRKKYVGNSLLTNIWRISNSYIESSIEGSEQEIILPKPPFGHTSRCTLV